MITNDQSNAFIYQQQVSPKSLQISLCCYWEDLVQNALCHIYSQPGVTQKVPFLTSL